MKKEKVKSERRMAAHRWQHENELEQEHKQEQEQLQIEGTVSEALNLTSNSTLAAADVGQLKNRFSVLAGQSAVVTAATNRADARVQGLLVAVGPPSGAVQLGGTGKKSDEEEEEEDEKLLKATVVSVINETTCRSSRDRDRDDSDNKHGHGRMADTPLLRPRFLTDEVDTDTRG